MQMAPSDAQLQSREPPNVRTESRSVSVLRLIAAAIFVVAVPVLLVTTVIRVLISDVGFYQRGLREHDAEARTGISLVELDYAAGEIVRYFENDARVLRVTVIVDGEEQPLFNEREVAHMEDVKSLVRLMFAVQEVSLVYTMAYVTGVFLWARERSLRALAWQALGAMAFGLGVVGAVGVLALSGFDAAWTRFHEIAFRNDLWRLDPASDRLIQMFPEPFWEEATMIVAAVSAGASGLVVVLAGGFLVWSTRARRRALTPALGGPSIASPGFRDSR